MTRKTYIKKVMGLGYSRNEANSQVEKVIFLRAFYKMAYSYKEDYKLLCDIQKLQGANNEPYKPYLGQSEVFTIDS